ncbi:uncharacterized protein HKW66_Vig0061590 [Vigna angularis]|uniref:Uncharacterized protein n=1 Tax=Phaseolus angularis TaxID=3914 RepID=A0A8T0L5R3_PHAAN|nr:uncharacterized protein HKW66_Vig0061590 [Vigna angularis]
MSLLIRIIFEGMTLDLGILASPLCLILLNILTIPFSLRVPGFVMILLRIGISLCVLKRRLGLTDLAQFEVMDVFKKNLFGDIPKFPTMVMLNTDFNIFLWYIEGGGGSGTTSSSGSGDTPIRSPNIASTGFSLSLAWIAESRKRKKKVVPRIEAQRVTMSIQFLQQVTKNFSEENILGKRDFEWCTERSLEGGTKIAVKIMECGSCRKGSKGMNWK